jgi:hypothetical protein
LLIQLPYGMCSSFDFGVDRWCRRNRRPYLTSSRNHHHGCRARK